METKDTCFCEESLLDRSFLVLEILTGGGGNWFVASMATQAKKAHGEYGKGLARHIKIHQNIGLFFIIS